MALNPVYFGESTRQLFGMYDPATTGGAHGAVLCAPWGQEYLRAHPSVRHLARLLARAGVHVFRFDYAGTGDSDGSDLDGSPSRFIADVHMAIEELKDTAGVRKVSLIGLRLGAAVAAMTARSRHDVHRLVLWDPVFDGAAYLRELAPSSSGTPPLNARGFLISQDAYVDIGSIDLRTFRGPLPQTLVVSTQSPDACRPLEHLLRSSGTDVVSEYRAGPGAWVEIGSFGASGMPVAALGEMARWVSS